MESIIRTIAWLNTNAGAVQAILTIILVIATCIYAYLTHRSLNVARESLKLSREQFEREWKPDLHTTLDLIPVSHTSSAARLTVTNLGRVAVVLHQLTIGVKTNAGESDHGFSANAPIRHGEAYEEDITKKLERTLEREGRLSKDAQQFRAGVSIWVTFYSTGKLSATDAVSFNVESSEGRITRVSSEYIGPIVVRSKTASD